MKLLHCINSPHIGGIERLVIELAIAQKKKGINVSIMLNTKEGQYFEHLIKQDIPILYSGIKNGFDFNLSTYKKLKQKFSAFNVVHMHSFSPLRSFAAKNSSAKIVYTLHGLSKGVRKENKIKYFIREYLKRYILNSVDAIIANSNHTFTLAKEHYGLKQVSTHVILNGINISEIKIKKKESRLHNELLTIGLVSRFTYRKRIDRLINAFADLLKKGEMAHLILVGDGVEYGNIKNQINKLDLSKHIELTGYSKNVDSFYKKFDICVHPSDNEGFGLVAVEAYMHGLPVIAFNDSGGLVEVIKPLQPENLVTSVSQLTDRLYWYCKNRNEITKNRMKHINYAQENFSIERMETDYNNIYNSLIYLC
jgi:glycosyltransferase involved in cell wall biosynthesis